MPLFLSLAFFSILFFLARSRDTRREAIKFNAFFQIVLQVATENKNLNRACFAVMPYIYWGLSLDCCIILAKWCKYLSLLFASLLLQTLIFFAVLRVKINNFFIFVYFFGGKKNEKEIFLVFLVFCCRRRRWCAWRNFIIRLSPVGRHLLEIIISSLSWLLKFHFTAQFYFSQQTNWIEFLLADINAKFNFVLQF